MICKCRHIKFAHFNEEGDCLVDDCECKKFRKGRGRAKMARWLVTFGFEVEANNNEEARIKAKKNLKAGKDRGFVCDYRCRRIRFE